MAKFPLFLQENLALQKPAWQENNWQDKETDWGAEKAVDGRYTDRSAGGNQCTISAGGQTAEWGVDLGRVVSISYIKMYYRTDNKPGSFFDRFAGYFLYVSNSTLKNNGTSRLCFHDHQNVNGTPTDDQRINCSVYGRYVIYYNERRPDVTYPSYYSPDAYNELCEVEVYVNLALGRPAWLQHKWSFTRRIWGAEKAVDGQYTDRSAAGNQCTISGPGYQTAEWRVDLQDIVSISHIQIYYRTENTPGPNMIGSEPSSLWTSAAAMHVMMEYMVQIVTKPVDTALTELPVTMVTVIVYRGVHQGMRDLHVTV
ncbi:uncharacterized protein LOC134245990, partial [Saccostrea cucullata]|uniref:uncharacterized protein LOC134245990 n=1 Tax=Saccostrea cuccullata TaxID=36930 RepID=UPI002ECFF337